MTNKPQMILMMGGQGVGKGTFSKMLMARHPYKHIETGAILRSMPDDSPIKKIIATGNLVSDDILFDLMRNRINPDSDVIIDGFPRKLSQAKWLVENYADKFNIHVLYLAAPTDVLIARINKRIREGSSRKDDASPDAIRRRLENFFNETMPAINWLRDAPNIHFAQVDSRGSIDENFAEIITALKK